MIQELAPVVLIVLGALAVAATVGCRAAASTIQADLRRTSEAIGRVLDGADEASRILVNRAGSLDAALTAAFASMAALTGAASQYRDMLPDLGELIAGVARTGSTIIQSLDNVSRGLTGVGSMLGRASAPDPEPPQGEASE